MIPASPPVRAVLMTEKALGIKLEHIMVDLLKGEHLKPEYLKINPQHTVPVLDDDGTVICDSQAILIYLVEKYANNSAYYPNDPTKRAKINHRLFYNAGVAFAHARNIVGTLRAGGSITEKHKEDAYAIYDTLEQFFNGNKYIAGDDLTIADFSLLATTSTLNLAVPIDQKKYQNIAAWIKHAESCLFYEPNREGLVAMKGFLELLMGKK